MFRSTFSRLLCVTGSLSSKKLVFPAPLLRFLSQACPNGKDHHRPVSVHAKFAELETVWMVEALECLRSEPDMAVSLFNKAKKGGFRHGSDTYAAVLQILCDSGPKTRLHSFLSEMVTSPKDKLRFELLSVLRALLKRPCKGSEACDKVFDALVKIYVSLNMLDEAVAMFDCVRKYTTTLGFHPPEQSCNYLFNHMVDCGLSESARGCLLDLMRSGLCRHFNSFSILIKSCCIENNIEELMCVYLEMGEMGLEDDQYSVVTTLIDHFCSYGRPDKGYDFLRKRRDSDSQLQLPTFSYNAVMRGFCEKKMLQEAEAVLDDMKNQKVKPNGDSYTCLIKEYCKIGDSGKAMSLHEEMVREEIFSSVAVTSLLGSLCTTGKMDIAIDLLDEYRETGLCFDNFTYGIMIDAHCELGNVEKAIVLFSEMKVRGLLPDVIIYTSLIKGHCRLSNTYGDTYLVTKVI